MDVESTVARAAALQAVKHMLRDKTDRGAALRDAAMRQHDNIIDTAVAVRRRRFRATHAALDCPHAEPASDNSAADDTGAVALHAAPGMRQRVSSSRRCCGPPA